MSFRFFGTRPNCCQCLPKGRDWSKGEKCGACDRKNDECGPNVRANRPSHHPTYPQVTPPAEQLLGPSYILEKVSTGISSQHTEAAQQVEAGASELEKDTLHGNLWMSTGANVLNVHGDAREDEFPGHRNPIASRYVGCLHPRARTRFDRCCAIVSYD
jgi:hypothetical protein